MHFKHLQKFLAIFISLVLIGCTTTLPVNESVETKKEVRPPKFDELPPLIREILERAYQAQKDPKFTTNYRNELLSLYGNSTPKPEKGDFKVKFNGNDIIYALGGNGEDQIYELDRVTPKVTLITETINSENVAVIAKQPLTADVFYATKNPPHELYKYDRDADQHVKIGDLTESINIRLDFHPDGTLYGSTKQKFYKIDHTDASMTEIPITGWVESSKGDLGFSQSGEAFISDADNLYSFDLAAQSMTFIAPITGTDNIEGLAVDDEDKLLAVSRKNLYEINKTTGVGTFIGSLGNPKLSDIASAGYVDPALCIDRSIGAPTTPTFHLDPNFSAEPSDFGNEGLGVDKWAQWGGDYYPVPAGVALWNPGPQQGTRDVPGEYIAERPGLYETGIYRTLPIFYNAGDKFVAKTTVGAEFTDTDSDATILLYFNNPGKTIAVGNTMRNSGSQELFVESAIPPCTTAVTVVALGYLGFDETKSLTFEKLTLEQVPGTFYDQTTLLNEPLDAFADNQYGTNSPANVDEEFGYDLYVVDSHPLKYAGDKAVTVTLSAEPAGGMVKRVNLPAYNPGDLLTAFIYGAATFTDANSEAFLKMEFYDAGDNLLGTEISAKINHSNYRWLNIDRAPIPANTTYVKLVPTVTMGSTEASSMLLDDLQLYLLQP